MAISPVCSVSLGNYSNVSFGGKREKKGEHPVSSHSSTPIKTVPLALLIALSPVSVNNVSAKEPLINEIEQVQEIGSTEENQKISLPSNFSYLNKYVVDMPNDEKLGLYFIDSNGDKKNYEYFEYIHLDKNGDAKARGLLTHIKFMTGGSDDFRAVVLYGIGLSKNDEKDYAPRSIMADRLVSRDAFDFFLRILNEPSNNAFESLPKGISYGGRDTRGIYLDKYEKDLGIY